VSENIWYPKYVGDYAAKTSHLKTIEHGAYNLLLDFYWVNKGPIREDIVQRVTKMSDKEWSESEFILKSFFDQVMINGNVYWKNKRVEEELSKKKQRSELSKKANSIRWSKSKGKGKKSDKIQQLYPDGLQMDSYS